VSLHVFNQGKPKMTPETHLRLGLIVVKAARASKDGRKPHETQYDPSLKLSTSTGAPAVCEAAPAQSLDGPQRADVDLRGARGDAARVPVAHLRRHHDASRAARPARVHAPSVRWVPAREGVHTIRAWEQVPPLLHIHIRYSRKGTAHITVAFNY